MAVVDTPTNEAGNGARSNSASWRRRSWTTRASAGHVLVVVAAVLAALANFAILRAGDETVRVAVAATELLPGDVVEASWLRFVDVRVSSDVLETLIEHGRTEAAAGAIVVSRVPAGDLVRWSDLTDPGAESGLRAMSVPVDPAHAVGGRLRAGDRIDVIEVTAEGATYIALGLHVLDVADRTGGALGGLSPYSVTVSVDAETALRLANAMRSDAIEIVRSTGAAEPDVTVAPAERSAPDYGASSHADVADD